MKNLLPSIHHIELVIIIIIIIGGRASFISKYMKMGVHLFSYVLLQLTLMIHAVLHVRRSIPQLKICILEITFIEEIK